MYIRFIDYFNRRIEDVSNSDKIVDKAIQEQIIKTLDYVDESVIKAEGRDFKFINLYLSSVE